MRLETENFARRAVGIASADLDAASLRDSSFLIYLESGQEMQTEETQSEKSDLRDDNNATGSGVRASLAARFPGLGRRGCRVTMTCPPGSEATTRSTRT